jgi:hypothetical protein
VSGTHLPHPERNADGLPLLFDGCGRCEEQALNLGLLLDNDRWRKAWAQMIRIEFKDEGGYLSDADKRLGRDLYYMALLLQRQGMEPVIFG